MNNQNLPPVRLPSIMWLILAAILLVLSAIGRAEQAGPGGDAPVAQKAPEAEVAPRGQRMPREIKYGDWRKVCFKTPGTSIVCRTTISGTWDTGQTVVRADLIERQGEGAQI